MRSLTIFLAALLIPAAVVRAEDRTAPAIDRLCRAYKLDILDDAAVRTTLRNAARTREDVRRGLTFYETGWKLVEDFRRSRERSLLFAIAVTNDRDLHTHLSDLANCYHADVLPAVNYVSLALFTTQKDLGDLRILADPEFAYERLRRTYAAYRGLGNTPEASCTMAIEDCGGPTGEITNLRSRMTGYGRLVLTGYDAADADKDARTFLEASYAYFNSDAKDIKGVRRVDSAFEYINLRVADGIRRDNQTMIRPVKTIIERVMHEPAAGSGRQVASGDANPQSAIHNPQSAMGDPPPFDQIEIPLKITVDNTWSWGDWPTRAATNIPFMSGRDKEGPWYKLRQTDGTKNSWLNCLTYGPVPASSPRSTFRVVFYVWYWGASDASTFFVAGGDEKTVPLAGRFTLGPSPGKMLRIEITAPHADGYGHIWLHFGGIGKFALGVGRFYKKDEGG